MEVRVEGTAPRRVVSLLEENNFIETEGKNDRADVNLLIQLQKCRGASKCGDSSL